MILKNKIDSDSSLVLEIDDATISAGPNSFTSTRADGNFVNGPLSISSDFTKMRFGAIYKFNPLLANTIPSNVITPIPVLEVRTPVREAAGLLAISGMILGSL